MDTKQAVLEGRTVLGIEFGSTRIKAVLVDENTHPIAQGGYDWENRYVDNIWSYTLEDIWKGLQGCYREMAENVKKTYGVTLKKTGAIGFSGMMHGYMPFDKAGKLLVPFRTWRNNITGQASDVLSGLFNFQIPQRWSIAHLYQAILNGEEHVKDIDFFTTLAGYIHWKLTGEKVIGIGEASGMFPIDVEKKDFYPKMLDQFDGLVAPKGYTWKIREILPKVLVAGEQAGTLTEEGAKLLDVTGELEAGIPLCPPEGDAGTGMAATNSVRQRTGNVSAGTSVFAMLVLERELSTRYPEIDMVTTPAGDSVAMVHSNNCTSDLNAWVGLFDEFAAAIGAKNDKNQLFSTLYNKALEGDKDCGGLLAYGYQGESLHSPRCPKDRTGYPFLQGRCESGQDPGPRRSLQDTGCGTEDPGSSHERPCFRDGDGRRGRGLGNCPSGLLYAAAEGRRESGGLSGQRGVCGQQGHPCGAGPGRCGWF